MHVELRDAENKLVGTVDLAGSTAVLEDAEKGMGEFLDKLTVVAPGVGPVGLEHGERYLRALPVALHGPYLSATLVAA